MFHTIPQSFSIEDPEPQENYHTTFPWPSHPDWHVAPGFPHETTMPAMDSELQLTPAEALLEDELKVDATRDPGLWNHVRDLLALSWWTGPQTEQSSSST